MPAFAFLLRFSIEALQLAAALPLRLLQLQLSLGAMRALVVDRLCRGRLDALPVVQLLLALLLVDLKLPCLLLLPRVAGRNLRSALVLLHAQLERVLLLLPLQLVLLQSPRARVLGARSNARNARAGEGHDDPPNPWNGSCVIHDRALLAGHARWNLSEQ